MAGPDTPAESTRSEKNARYLWPLGLTAGYLGGGWELLQGDSIALRLVMERVAPVRRGRPVQFDLPALDNASDLALALGGILRATANGSLTPDEAATIAGVLETKRRAIETSNLEQRLDQLEQRLVPGSGR